MYINIVVCVAGGGVVPGKAEEDLFAILMTYSKAWPCLSSHLVLLLLILREEGEKAGIERDPGTLCGPVTVSPTFSPRVKTSPSDLSLWVPKMRIFFFFSLCSSWGLSVPTNTVRKMCLCKIYVVYV